jgi:hypothetical protein
MVLPIFSKSSKKKFHFKSTSSPPSILMKCEDTMKVMQNMKHHCPQDKKTHWDEETEEFTPTSPPRKMAARAPLVYVIPNNDDDYELLLFVRSLSV